MLRHVHLPGEARSLVNLLQVLQVEHEPDPRMSVVGLLLRPRRADAVGQVYLHLGQSSRPARLDPSVPMAIQLRTDLLSVNR